MMDGLRHQDEHQALDDYILALPTFLANLINLRESDRFSSAGTHETKGMIGFLSWKGGTMKT